MIFAAIADGADSEEFDVKFMCAELGVSTSGYYAWRGRAPSAREVADEALLAAIRTAHQDLDGNPGVRRTWAHPTASGGRSGTSASTGSCAPQSCRAGTPRPGRSPRSLARSRSTRRI